ncbi:MAG: hypothetical protein ACRD0L_14945 [Acidimicrobiales bacterium]
MSMLAAGGMMRYEVRFRGRVQAITEDGAALEGPLDKVVLREHLDRVMEELLGLRAIDPAVSADLGRRGVEIEVVVDALDGVDAVAIGNGLIRTAVHAAGGFTKGWSSDWLEITGVSTDELVDA